MKPVGPSPLPEQAFASRSLPVTRAVFLVARTVLWIVLIACIGAVFLFALSHSSSGTSLPSFLGRTFPIPVARVGAETILNRDFQIELDGWTHFYETAGALDALDAKRLHDRILDRKITQEIVRQLAVELGVDDIAEEVEVLYQSMAADRGSEMKLVEDIEQRFGWTKNVFIAVIVEPIVYARRVDVALKESDDFQSAPLALAEQARLDLIAQTSAFVGMDNTGTRDEYLLSLDAYPLEAHEALRMTDIGLVTDIIETDERFMVFKILERRDHVDDLRLRTEEFSVDKLGLYDLIAQRRATLEIKVFER